MKNLKKLVGVVAFAVSFGASGEKIGLVDVNKIMAQSKETSVIKKQLEKKYRPREQALIDQQNAIQADIQKLQRDDAIMTEAQKKALQDKIMKARKDFEDKGRAFQQEVNHAQNDAMQKLFTRVKVVIDEVAKAGKYDLILQKDVVQYHSGSTDEITTDVIAKLK